MVSKSAEGLVSAQVVALAEEIKEKGRQSAAELPALLRRAEVFAADPAQDLPSRAIAHRAAGNALHLLNQFEPALFHYDQAVQILECSPGQESELGRTLIARVGLLHKLSRFDDLFACAERTRALLQNLGDRRGLGRLDINLAHAYFRLDRHLESLECSERALKILETVGDLEGVLGATINSAVILASLHDFERAEASFLRAAELSTELKLTSWTQVSRLNLAYLRYLRGEPGEALKELSRLRSEFSACRDDRRVCLCWLDEAEILLEIGDLGEAIRVARTARVLAEKLNLNLETGRSFLFEGIAALRSGADGEAMALLAKASRRFEIEGNGVLAAVSRLQIALFEGERGSSKSLFEAASVQSILKISGLPNRQAFADIVIGRLQRANGDFEGATHSFRSALELADQSRSKWMQFHACFEVARSLERQRDPNSNQLFRRAENLLDSLWDKLGSDDLKMAFLADRETVYTHLLTATLSKSSDAGFEISEKSRSRVLCERLLGGHRLSAADIQSRLSPDETVVEYFIAGDDLHIFVVDRDEMICVRRSGVMEKVEVEIESLERHLYSCSVKWERLRAAAEHLKTTAETHLRILYEELLGPVRARLRTRITIVPHGILHTVPFQALCGGNGFLAESHEISYSPSARLYCGGIPARRDGPALFIAFSTKDDTTTVQEIEEAAQTIPGSAVLVNPAGAVLRDSLSVPRSLVHVAGHAGIDAVTGTISWIETPDGRLTGRDFTDMQIQAKTVVITGCQTARRHIRPGDEWLGLMRSFYLSGASTIVSALWDIRDEAARRFSHAFYQHFDGGNAREAAHRACGLLRSWQDHPYFWAGFGVFVRKTNLEAV